MTGKNLEIISQMSYGMKIVFAWTDMVSYNPQLELIYCIFMADEVQKR